VGGSVSLKREFGTTKNKSLAVPRAVLRAHLRAGGKGRVVGSSPTLVTMPQSFELVIARSLYNDSGAEQRVARERDKSAVYQDGATAPFMRAPSNVDALNAEDAGEFPTTLPYAAGSAEGCAPRVRANGVSPNAKRKNSSPPEMRNPARGGVSSVRIRLPATGADLLRGGACTEPALVHGMNTKGSHPAKQVPKSLPTRQALGKQRAVCEARRWSSQNHPAVDTRRRRQRRYQ
jgi:hypothetical protein